MLLMGTYWTPAVKMARGSISYPNLSAWGFAMPRVTKSKRLCYNPLYSQPTYFVVKLDFVGNVDLKLCNSDLSDCNSDLCSCNCVLGTCKSDLRAYNSDLYTCKSDLYIC